MTLRTPRTAGQTVLVVAPRFPPDVGGLEKYAGWVAGLLRDRPGTRVVVLSTARGRRREVEVRDGIEVIRLGTWLTLSNTPLNPLWWWQVRAVLRRIDPDVVNVHAPVPGLGDVAVLVGGRRWPVVLTYHAGSLVKGLTDPVGRAVDALLRAYERWVLPRVIDRCRALVAVSPVSLVWGTGRAELIPPGVDTEVFTPAAAERSHAPRVLYAGRVESTSRWKGVDVLLDAMALVAQRVPDVVLDLAGDGDDVPRLRERAGQLGLAERVCWHGSLGQAELARLYAGTWVTVLPSLTEAESFGMTLVEAMAAGSAVVGSRVGGIPFVVRDGEDGVLVPPGDAPALASALTDLLTDRDRVERMGRAGRSAAVERWEWTHQRERTCAVLEGAMRPNRSK